MYSALKSFHESGPQNLDGCSVSAFICLVCSGTFLNDKKDVYHQLSRNAENISIMHLAVSGWLVFAARVFGPLKCDRQELCHIAFPVLPPLY